jgi:HSP20 family protein
VITYSHALETLFPVPSALPVETAIPSNLIETWGHYHLQLALPGVSPSDLEIEVVSRTVTVSGTYRTPVIESGEMLRREIPDGTFRYSFDLPGPVDPDSTQATYAAGILTIRLPKIAYLRPARVPIDVIESVR